MRPCRFGLLVAALVAVAVPASAQMRLEAPPAAGGSTYTGTANQVIVTGTVLSTPQDIGAASTPRFGALGLGIAAGASGITFSDATVQTTAASGVVTSITGTVGQIAVGGTAAVPILSTPQDIATTSTPRCMRRAWRTRRWRRPSRRRCTGGRSSASTWCPGAACWPPWESAWPTRPAWPRGSSDRAARERDRRDRNRVRALPRSGSRCGAARLADGRRALCPDRAAGRRHPRGARRSAHAPAGSGRGRTFPRAGTHLPQPPDRRSNRPDCVPLKSPGKGPRREFLPERIGSPGPSLPSDRAG